jgi:4,5:9,10-diseco-3-hydroxy-5,9,17-trioxoandrosta-1(10),2-diene-4-oate hydrolase
MYEEQLAQKIGTGIRVVQKPLGNLTINYVVCGSGSPILLLHGANIGWGMWYKTISELAQHHTVYALDLPGSGGSTKGNFRHFDLVTTYVQTVEDFMMSESRENWAIIGHSFGGWIALQVAARKNISVSKLVLIDSLGFTRHLPLKHRLATFYSLAKFLSKTALKPDRVTMRKFLFEVFYDPSQGEELFFNYFYESLFRSKLSHPLLFINSLGQWGRLRSELEIEDDRIASVTIPTMIMWGDNDCSMPYFYSKLKIALLPQHTLHLLTQTGHVPPVEQPKKVNKLITQFLS